MEDNTNTENSSDAPGSSQSPIDNQVEQTTQPTHEDGVKADPGQSTEAPKKELQAEKLAVAARKEAKIRAEREALKAEREKMEGERKAIEALKANKPQNAIEALEAAGYTPDQAAEQLVEWAINDKKIPVKEPKKPTIDDEVAFLKAKLAAIDQEKEDAQRQAMEDQVAQEKQAFEAAISEHYTSTDKYVLLQSSNSPNLVRDTIEEYYSSTGKMLSVEEACDAVETYLEQQLTAYMEQSKMASDLLAKKRTPKNNQTGSADKSASLGSSLKNPISSLSNSLTSQPTSKGELTPEEQERLLDELIARL